MIPCDMSRRGISMLAFPSVSKPPQHERGSSEMADGQQQHQNRQQVNAAAGNRFLSSKGLVLLVLGLLAVVTASDAAVLRRSRRWQPFIISPAGTRVHFLPADGHPLSPFASKSSSVPGTLSTPPLVSALMIGIAFLAFLVPFGLSRVATQPARISANDRKGQDVDSPMDSAAQMAQKVLAALEDSSELCFNKTACDMTESMIEDDIRKDIVTDLLEKMMVEKYQPSLDVIKEAFESPNVREFCQQFDCSSESSSPEASSTTSTGTPATTMGFILSTPREVAAFHSADESASHSHYSLP